MQRLFNVGQAPLDLGNDLDEVVHVKTAASRTRNHGDAARAQAQRLNNLPGNTHFFLRLGGKRNTNRVANAFVQQNAESDGRLDSSAKGRAGFGYAEVKWIVDLL